MPHASKWRIALVFCGGGGLCLAQSGATFSTAANLVVVPVVVRDAQGNAVGTLHQEDFRLFDRGKLQTITRFSIEKTDAAPRPPEPSVATDADGNSRPTPAGTPTGPPIAEHFLAWLFDDVHISFSELVQMRAAALRVLKEPFDPGMRAAIFTTSGQVMLDFTNDRDKLAQAINQIRPFPAGSGGPEDCFGIGYYQAERILSQDDGEARTAAEVDYAMNCVHPDRRGWPDAMIEAHQAVRVLTQQALNLGKQATEANLAALKNLIQRMALLPGTRSVVLVSPGFFLADDRHDGEADVTEQAIRANVIISSLNSHGVAPSGYGATGAGAPPALLEVKAAFDRRQSYADEAVMENLADATGGTLFHNDNGYFEGFRRSTALPEYIYMLGFVPQSLKPDGIFHKLKVTLRSSAGLQLQSRRGYFAHSSGIDAATQGQDAVKDALFSRDEIRDLPVEVSTEIRKKGDGKFELSIVARVNLKGLHFRKADGRNNDTLTVASGVFDRNGKYVTGSQKTVDLKLTNETLDEFPKERLRVEANLDVASGSYIVRLVVRDSEGPAMSAQNSAVQIP